MIASFSHGFVFIKTHKTGGTSLEIVLSSWCAPGDVVTPISDVDEPARTLAAGLRTRTRVRGPAWRDQRRAARPVGTLLRTGVAGRGVYNHMSAAAVRDVFPDLWERAFTFAVERHPYEKVVSLASWQVARGGVAGEGLGEAIERIIARGGPVDRHRYLIDGAVGVDRVIRYEDMWSEVGELGRGWDRVLPAELPRAKAHQRTDRRSAREILTSDQQRRIRLAMAFEFETFGFEP